MTAVQAAPEMRLHGTGRGAARSRGEGVLYTRITAAATFDPKGNLPTKETFLEEDAGGVSKHYF